MIAAVRREQEKYSAAIQRDGHSTARKLTRFETHAAVIETNESPLLITAQRRDREYMSRPRTRLSVTQKKTLSRWNKNRIL